jgi:hypothetical protein
LDWEPEARDTNTWLDVLVVVTEAASSGRRSVHHRKSYGRSGSANIVDDPPVHRSVTISGE